MTENNNTELNTEELKTAYRWATQHTDDADDSVRLAARTILRNTVNPEVGLLSDVPMRERTPGLVLLDRTDRKSVV